jgi:glycosyltransferase involved in cell wall biosynthesis
MNPLISIIIPAFNVEDYVADAIRSAQAQTLDDLEIIVIDDSSTDGTRRIVEGFRSDPRVRLILNEPSNSGTSGARNAGLQVARGQYIGFLDADDIWHPTKAQRHLSLMENQPDIDLTFSRWNTIDEHGVSTGRVTRPPRKRRFQMEDLLKENLVGGSSNVVCRARAIELAGFFDASLKAAVDLDVWLRIAQLRDGNICFIDEVFTFYRLREGQITKDWRRMAQNWEIVLSKVRSEMPERVTRVEKEARAKHLRYRSYLAYEARDFASSRRLLWQAFSSASLPLFADRRTWITAAAVLASIMPDRVHMPLAAAVKTLRARVFARQPIRRSGTIQ